MIRHSIPRDGQHLQRFNLISSVRGEHRRHHVEVDLLLDALRFDVLLLVGDLHEAVAQVLPALRTTRST